MYTADMASMATTDAMDVRPKTALMAMATAMDIRAKIRPASQRRNNTPLQSKLQRSGSKARTVVINLHKRPDVAKLYESAAISLGGVTLAPAGGDDIFFMHICVNFEQLSINKGRMHNFNA